MKKIILIIVIWFIQSVCEYAFAQGFTLSDYVTDTTYTLSADQLLILNTQASDGATRSWYQIATLLIDHRNWRELYDIALETFRSNGIGQSINNNGVLLVVAVNEHKLRIMVWYGLEGALPDVYINKLIQEQLRPLLNSGMIFELVQTYQTQISNTIWSEQFRQPWWSRVDGSQFIIGFMIWYRLLTMLLGWLSYQSIQKAFHKPWSYWTTWIVVVWLLLAIVLSLVLWYIGFIIWSLLSTLYRNPHIKSFWWDHIYYGGWWWWWGWWWFGWFGGGSTWWWGAWD